jgi:hypothetical protein
MKSEMPIMPSLPTIAISADAPSSITYNSDTMHVVGEINVIKAVTRLVDDLPKRHIHQHQMRRHARPFFPGQHPEQVIANSIMLVQHLSLPVRLFMDQVAFGESILERQYEQRNERLGRVGEQTFASQQAEVLAGHRAQLALAQLIVRGSALGRRGTRRGTRRRPSMKCAASGGPLPRTLPHKSKKLLRN